MWIEKIEQQKKKWLVWSAGEVQFACYAKEVVSFEIEEESEWPEEQWERFKKEVLLPRAKRRVLYILQSAAKSEAWLREKLKTEYYPEDVTEQALQYVKSFHYVDDRRMAESYIRCRIREKSRREIEQQLVRKGIAKELITEAFEIVEGEYEQYESEGECPELEAIRKFLRKKGYYLPEEQQEGIEYKEFSYEEKQKLAAALLRKGFQMNYIKKVLF